MARVLKKDLFGLVEAIDHGGSQAVRRDTRRSRWWLRTVSRRLAAREARALRALDATEIGPRLLSFDGRVLIRTWLEGQPMQLARPRDPTYFSRALRLVGRLHRAGVVHNDLAKEPNWLVRPDGTPALLDFQIASVHPRRGRLFRLLAREDLRHLLKHKRTYCAAHLTEREQRILRTPSVPAPSLARHGQAALSVRHPASPGLGRSGGRGRPAALIPRRRHGWNSPGLYVILRRSWPRYSQQDMSWRSRIWRDRPPTTSTCWGSHGSSPWTDGSSCTSESSG